MARDIHECFEGESMTLLCILKGGFRFCQDLMNYIGAINCSSGMFLLFFTTEIF